MPPTDVAPASAASAQDRLDLLGRVVDPGHERRDEDPRRDAGRVERLDRLEARARAAACGARVARQAPSSRVGTERFAVTLGHRGDLLQQREVAQQQRGLRQHGARRRRVAQRGPDPRHEPVAALGPLVGVGVRPHRHVLVRPRRARQLGPQHLGHVDLDDDLLLEVPPRVHVEVRVGRTGEAVHAGMAAAPVRVDRPPERHRGLRRDAVERRLRANLVEARLQRLGRVEVADDRRLLVARQRGPSLLVDGQVRPAHANACSHVRRTGVAGR